MRIRSIRLSQWLLLASVISLVILAFSNIYIGKVIESAEVRYQAIVQMQKSFVDLVVMESRVLTESAQYGELLQSSLELAERMKTESKMLSTFFLTERERVFSTLLKTANENEQRYKDIRKTLPRLIDNVRYIHAYHVNKLQGALRSGETLGDRELLGKFVRGDQSEATELDIINEALEVHNRLMDVVALFYEMQVTSRTGDIEKIFDRRMDSLYLSINRFDDYTLDAQDGLLVEELLLTGNHFRESYGLLLKNNGKITLLKQKLEANQQQITAMFDRGAGELHKTKEALKRKLSLLQNVSIGLLLVLSCWLLSYGVRLSRMFTHTVKEARRIGNDLTYRIPEYVNSYQEFETIRTTLNALAETADQQIRSLEKMQSGLGRRVRERTAELVHMNTRLKNEIADRVKADESRRELEDRLIRAKKMEAVGTLAGGVAHDLNNILSGVVTYPELLLMDLDENDPLYQPMLNIKRSGERAAAIVQDLLTLARRGVTVNEVVDFRELVMEYLQSVEFCNVQKQYANIRLVVDLEEQTGNIQGSRLHLQKAIMNIILNGMEAMVDGGTLTVASRKVYLNTMHKGFETIKEGEYVNFSVHDTGVGMTPEVAEQIFEPFFTRKQMGRSSGTGLGMAVVYSTIKDHGGYIDVASEVGMGTTISLFLPSSSEESAKTPKEFNIENFYGRGELLLVVDDVVDQRQIASAMLKRLKYRVATAASGEEAVDYVRNNQVDLVVLDMIMHTGMDGLDTFLALKAVSPDIKVVIASGFSESDRVQRAQRVGAGTYIKKPYSIDTLGRAIHSILR